MHPRVSFIVPLHNQLALSKAMLESLLAWMPRDLPHEILLVDDASTDGTREWLTSLKTPNLRVLLNEKNLGYAGTNNRGAREAAGELLALLNNDLVLEPGWLPPMLELFRRHGPRTGVVGNLQLRISDHSLDHAGVRATCDAKLVHIRRQPKPVEDGIEVLAVTAACCLVRRQVFLDQGGFDEGFINGGEDIDLCLRLRSLGLRNYVAPDSVVGHHVSATRGGTSLKDERNSQRLFLRWREELENAVAAAWCEPAARCLLPFWQRLQAMLFQRGSLRSPPHTARLLAQSALHRELSRWQGLLHQAPTPAAELLSSEGFHWDAPTSPAWIKGRACLRLSPGSPSSGLFIAGHLSASPDGIEPCTQLGLRIRINQLQCCEHFPLPMGDFNLPVEHPASLPDRPTLVELEVFGHYPFSLGATLLTSLTFLDKGLRRRLRRHSRLHEFRRLRISAIVADNHQVADLSQPGRTGTSR